MRAIYRHYVDTSWVSFEERAPDLAEFSARVAKYLADWSCLVAEQQGQVVGYAYGSAHRDRPAYRWSVETTIYVRPGVQRAGIGRGLYCELFPRLQARGYCNAYAGVALPNEASVGLHLAVGFQPIGTFPRVGFRCGEWRDVAWFHRPLSDRPRPDDPA